MIFNYMKKNTIKRTYIPFNLLGDKKPSFEEA
jgi:hypothetical protein